MNPIASSTVPTTRNTPSRAPWPRAVLLTMVTLVATVLCLIAVHGFSTSHSMAFSAATGTAAHHVTTDTRPTAAPPVLSATRTGPTMTLAVPANQPTLCTQRNSLGGSGTVAMTCPNVLVVGHHAVLARMPADSGLVMASGGFVNDSFRAIPPHLHRPSLTLLSISRV